MGKPTEIEWGLFFLAGLFCASTAGGADSLLLLSRGEAKAIKAAVAAKDRHVMPAADRLRREAEKRLRAGPWSVTFHRPAEKAAGPHDFFSEGPYWWPDPAKPEGPYIRRDGEVNPNRFTANDDDLAEMSETVLTLGAAAWLFDDRRYADRAAKLISVWFIDSATFMNPNLEFGQAIRRVTTGRGTGIIDTVALIWAVQGMTFLDETEFWSPRDRNTVKQWFADYLEWLTTSKKGLDEKKSGNNHSTWWSAQVACYIAFASDLDELEMVWEHYRGFLIPHQMRADGSCPLEEARTKSLGYSAMNLNGFSILCRLASNMGQNLWRYRTPEGAGIEKAVAYLAPFIERPQDWRLKQIAPFSGAHSYFLALAGLALEKPEYLAAYGRKAAADYPWGMILDLVLRAGTRRPR